MICLQGEKQMESINCTYRQAQRDTTQYNRYTQVTFTLDANIIHNGREIYIYI